MFIKTINLMKIIIIKLKIRYKNIINYVKYIFSSFLLKLFILNKSNEFFKLNSLSKN